MDINSIKESFKRAKQDIFTLNKQIETIKNDIQEINRTLRELTNQTHNQINSTFHQIIPSHQQSEEAPKPSNLAISIGNDGVPTDRQTDRQTDRHIHKFAQLKDDEISKIDKLSALLNSLDSIKKDIRLKFKHLTPQEMTVFSTIYQLEEEGVSVDYSSISSKLSLSESSIRDYIQKLIKKGIPIQKFKQNNKKIILLVSKELKKIASLDTIIQLREI